MMKTLGYAELVMLVASALASTGVQAGGDVAAGKTKAAACVSCHGVGGNSVTPNFPKLAGQHANFVAKQLADFKTGETRSDAVMAGMVAALSEQDMADIGAYYSAQSPEPGMAASRELADLGERLYRGGDEAAGIPACMGCHGPAGGGIASAKFPALAAQHATYTAKALNDFKSGTRSNDYAHMMRDIAKRMDDDQIQAVSNYIAGMR